MGRNKNIKINIHINNDIIGGSKQKKNKKKHEKSLSFMSDKSGSEVVQMTKSSSVASPSKKKKKHKHKRHRSKKKNCSCQKHSNCDQTTKEIPTMDRAHSSHYFSPRSRKKIKKAA